jgi:hypothetical protein
VRAFSRRARSRLLLAGVTLGWLAGANAGHAAGAGSRGRELWLEPARVFGHKMWFADELEPIADAVAEVLARSKHGGYRVIPNQEMRRLWADAQRGQLPGRKEICETPPPPALLGEIVHPGALWASIEVRCEKSACQLAVDVFRREPTQKGERRTTTVARLGADLPSREDPVKWAGRIRRKGIKPRPPAREAGGLGLLGTLEGEGRPRPGIRVSVTEVQQSGTWAYTLDSSVFAAKAKALHACVPEKRVWRDWWVQPMVIEVNPDGRLSRCELAYPDHLPPPEHACQCQVLGGVGFRPGAAQRRAAFELRTIAPDQPAAADAYVRNAYLGRKQADDPSAILGTGEISNADLIRCLSPIRSAVHDLRVPVRFSVRDDGQTSGVRRTWPDSLSPAVTACLDGVLRAARFNCPLSGKAEVRGDLFISVQAGRSSEGSR